MQGVTVLALAEGPGIIPDYSVQVGAGQIPMMKK
jgi:hypothetical protein